MFTTPTRLPRRLLATAALLATFAAPAAMAGTTWITVGDKALSLLQKTAPEARVLSSARVPVTVPLQRGAPVLMRSTEGVHAVEVDEDALDGLSTALHTQLHKCSGFVQHASMAEALATLQLLQRPEQPTATPSYAIDNVATVNALLPQLQASNILSTITQLSNFQNRRHRSTHGVAASNWLFNQWKTLGGTRRGVKVTQITHASWPQKSVSFEIAGNGGSSEVIVIGAHLDSTVSGITTATLETARAPGADDDASGVATLTELIRVMMVNNYKPARTIRFVAYAAEEVGLLGSRDVVATANSQRAKVVGVMQLDMTAYAGGGKDLWIYTDYTNPAQNQFLANLAAAYLPELTVGYDVCGYGCSDHASWHNAGYVASFPFEAADSSYNFQLHTVNDTTATFGNQALHALKFAKLAMAYAVELGSDRVPVTLIPLTPGGPLVPVASKK